MEEQKSATRCSVYCLTSSSGRYAIKIYPAEYSVAELESEIAFASSLLREGIRVPQYLTTISGEAFTQMPGGERVVAYRWIDGKVSPALSEAQLSAAVGLLASIQINSSGLSLERPDEWLWSDALVCLERIRPPQDLAGWLNEMVQAGRPWDITAPRVVAHNDFVAWNLIWSADEELPGLIDFTNTILAPVEWDPAVFLASVLLSPIPFGSPGETIDRFFAAYDAAGGHLDAERTLRLLKVALAQRSVFFVLTHDAGESEATWERLRGALIA
jgi:Ser/Thr protein kinase RdoA (MazF antagonist)